MLSLPPPHPLARSLPPLQATQTILKCFVIILFSSHLTASFWALQASFQDSVTESWMGVYGYCTHCDEREGIRCITPGVGPTGAPWEGPVFAAGPFKPSDPPLFCYGEECDDACINPFRIYAAAIYWAVMTLTSVGYGDIGPTNTAEQYIVTLLMMVDAVLWGYVIGSFCGVITTMNPENTAFRNMYDDLNRFIEQKNLPGDIALKLREYFLRIKHLQTSKHQAHLIEKLSPKLQGEVTYLCHSWIKQIGVFKSLDDECLFQIAMCMHSFVFPPGEWHIYNSIG